MAWQSQWADPQIEKALLKADCGAEMAKWPSGHKVWRVSQDQLNKLPPTPPGSGRLAGPYTIPVKSVEGDKEFIGSTVYAPYAAEQLVSDWEPIKRSTQ